MSQPADLWPPFRPFSMSLSNPGEGSHTSSSSSRAAGDPWFSSTHPAQIRFNADHSQNKQLLVFVLRIMMSDVKVLMEWRMCCFWQKRRESSDGLVWICISSKLKVEISIFSVRRLKSGNTKISTGQVIFPSHLQKPVESHTRVFSPNWMFF